MDGLAESMVGGLRTTDCMALDDSPRLSPSEGHIERMIMVLGFPGTVLCTLLRKGRFGGTGTCGVDRLLSCGVRSGGGLVVEERGGLGGGVTRPFT